MKSLETERLRLRPFTKDDALFVLRLVNDFGWLLYIGDRGIRTVDDAVTYIGKMTDMYEKYGHGALLISLKDSGTPIGLAGLFRRAVLDDADIGFALLPEFYGQGYAFEASAVVLQQGRDELGLKRITGITIPSNRSSIKLMEKLGLTFEKSIRLPNDNEDVSLYVIDLGRAIDG